MKQINLYLLLLFLLSCTVPADSGSNAAATATTVSQSGGETTTTTIAGDTSSDPITSTSTTLPSSGSTAVTFRNNSAYDVNVYIGINPYYGTAAFTVGKGDAVSRNVIPSESVIGDTFYIEYLIPIGEQIFPYWPMRADVGYKTMLLSETDANELTIDSLTECPTNDSYILLENKTTSDIYVNRKAGDAGFRVNPYGQPEIYNIPRNGSAVYEISEESQTLKPSQVQSLRIVRNVFNEQVLPKPLDNTAPEPGMIYTVTVTNESAVLKSVTPFDIDLQNQIWEIDCDPYIVNCICRSQSVDGGTVLFGSKMADGLFSNVLDRYGKQHSACVIPMSGLRTKAADSRQCFVYDGLENEDGTIVLLADIVYDGDVTDDVYLLCYDPADKAFRWAYPLAECVGDAELLIRWSCQATVIRRSPNVYAVGCASVRDGRMHRFFAEFDCTNADNIHVRSYCSPDSTDVSDNTETMFCSVYYDSVHGEYIAVGYDKFNPDYPIGQTHYGVIYRIYADASDDLTADTVASYDNCLFFGIDGHQDDYYICGEAMLTGKILQGCYLSSSMVAENVAPRTCPSVNTHCWYNQISLFDDKIICCGQSSADFSGTADSVPIVTAFDLDDSIIWENTSFDGWTEADSCFPNGIGSYIIELYDAHSERSAIVSADLMGRNTGPLVGILQ